MPHWDYCSVVPAPPRTVPLDAPLPFRAADHALVLAETWRAGFPMAGKRRDRQGAAEIWNPQTILPSVLDGSIKV